MKKMLYWTPFRSDNQIALGAHTVHEIFGGGLVYMPFLYKTKRLALKEGWKDVRKVSVTIEEFKP